MKKLSRFFKNIYRSIFDLGFYQELLKTPFSFSLKYLYLLLYLTVFIGTIFFLPEVFKLKDQLPKFTKAVQQTSQNYFPQELVVSVKNGTLSTNVKEPYSLPLPTGLKDKDGQGLDNLVVIDTKASPEDIKNYSTAVLITKKALVYPRDKNYEFFLFDNIKQNITINKNTYEGLINRAIDFLNHLPQFLPLAIIALILIWPFIGAGLNLFAYLLVLFFYFLLPFLIAKLLRKNISFAKTYQLAIHCSTLIILANLLFSLLANISALKGISTAFNRVEYWVFLIWTTFIIYKIKAPGKKSA